MSGGYNPKVSNPNAMLSQMKSGELQPPFYFGGSQVPVDLGLSRKTYGGSGVVSEPSAILRRPKPAVYLRGKITPVSNIGTII